MSRYEYLKARYDASAHLYIYISKQAIQLYGALYRGMPGDKLLIKIAHLHSNAQCKLGDHYLKQYEILPELKGSATNDYYDSACEVLKASKDAYESAMSDYRDHGESVPEHLSNSLKRVTDSLLITHCLPEYEVTTPMAWAASDFMDGLPELPDIPGILGDNAEG